jgi:hypothetical protein
MSSSVRNRVSNVFRDRLDEVKNVLIYSDEVKETMKEVAINKVKDVARSVGLQLPPEIFSLGYEPLEKLLESADISIDMEDVKDALTEVGIDNFELSEIPFGNLIDTASNILSEKVPIVKTIRNITDKVPESLRKKVIEAGGSLADSLKFRGSEQKQERKVERESKRYEIPSGVSDIFGRVKDEPDDGGPPDDRGPPDGGIQKDQRSLLVDEINNINLKLEDLARGKSLKYPEMRDVKQPYRFPGPSENYNAVPLVQNAVTNYMNDLNLYGSSDVNYNEI